MSEELEAFLAEWQKGPFSVELHEHPREDANTALDGTASSACDGCYAIEGIATVAFAANNGWRYLFQNGCVPGSFALHVNIRNADGHYLCGLG